MADTGTAHPAQVTAEENRQLAAVALQFLQRTQMTGADADNYLAVRNWLMMVANGNLLVSPQPSTPGPSA